MSHIKCRSDISKGYTFSIYSTTLNQQSFTVAHTSRTSCVSNQLDIQVWLHSNGTFVDQTNEAKDW